MPFVGVVLFIFFHQKTNYREDINTREWRNLFSRLFMSDACSFTDQSLGHISETWWLLTVLVPSWHLFYIITDGLAFSCVFISPLKSTWTIPMMLSTSHAYSSRECAPGVYFWIDFCKNWKNLKIIKKILREKRFKLGTSQMLGQP